MKKKKDSPIDPYRVEEEFGGKKLVLETGKLANLADGSVIAHYGETVVLATAVISDESKEDANFFPMTVEYEERMYASGKIMGSRFIKRESRPSEKAVVKARLIDRPIRPLFPKGYRNEVQIVTTILSADLENDPDVISIVAASSALLVAGAPFLGPVGAVRVGLIKDKFIANPTRSERKESGLDLVVSGTKDAIVMVEAEVNELPEEKMLAALKFGQTELKKSIELQEKLIKKIQITPKEVEVIATQKEIYEAVDKYLANKLGAAIRHEDKYARHDAIKTLENEVLEELRDEYEEEAITAAFNEVIEDEVRRAILKEDVRPDGRKPKDIRPLSLEVGLLPRTHGSAIFTRGQTQVLSITTLGTTSDVQVLDTMEEDGEKRFMHHYNFPPYSTGEIRSMRISRRDVGHGMLVEKALTPLLPLKEEFPYTIRVVSEILSCNGSSSMASVCGSSLSLMDAGVPIKTHVAGIAIGLVTDYKRKDNKKETPEIKNYKILTDIAGAEDFAGDMDFKIAGTTKGITALQLDIKIKGITLKILKEAIIQAHEARMSILKKMSEIILKPRKDISPLAPRITSVKVEPEKIKDVIGKGGETINKIISETGVEIDIEDDGTVNIASSNKDKTIKALEWIQALTKEPKVGETYMGKVTKIMDFGAFVQIMPGKEGLVHISQLANYRVNRVEDVVKVGDVIPVVLVEIDNQGRLNFSKKAAEKR